MSQLLITYREGSSGPSIGRRLEVQPGDRLPYVDFDGVNNHGTLQSCDWQVHVYRSINEVRIPESVLDLPVHHFPWNDGARRKGIEQDVYYLIRPDGHVAAIQAMNETDGSGGNDLGRASRLWFKDEKASTYADG